VHFLCVGTPQSRRSEAADLTHVDDAIARLAVHLRGPALLVGRSTVPVGTAARLQATLHELAGPVVTAVSGAELLLGALGLLLAVLGVDAGAWLTAGFLAPLGYLGGALVATWFMGRGLPWRAWVLLPAVVTTMHLSWGWVFLRSIPRSRRRPR
jgi:hypothetical protein